MSDDSYFVDERGKLHADPDPNFHPDAAPLICPVCLGERLDGQEHGEGVCSQHVHSFVDKGLLGEPALYVCKCGAAQDTQGTVAADPALAPAQPDPDQTARAFLRQSVREASQFLSPGQIQAFVDDILGEIHGDEWQG